MHIAVSNNGVVKIPDKTSLLKKLFCKHEIVTGEKCSANGLFIISGTDNVTVCKKCGKIIDEEFVPYD